MLIYIIGYYRMESLDFSPLEEEVNEWKNESSFIEPHKSRSGVYRKYNTR